MGDRESSPFDDRSVLGSGRTPGPRGLDLFDDSSAAMPADSPTAPRVTTVTIKGHTDASFDSSFFMDELKAKLQAVHDAEEASRQKAAKSKSAALDPFKIDVDINCDD